MEQGNTTSLEMNNTSDLNITIRPETAKRMLGVFLFYVILFVAVSVFTN
jgi:hypothetical protein